MERIYENRVIVLDRGEFTSCTINLYGATVTSWIISNKEQLFQTLETRMSHVYPFGSGISFDFPHLGVWPKGPDNGFARQVQWKVKTEPASTEDFDVFAELVLANDAYTESLWSYKFRICCKITLYERKLGFDIEVTNRGDYFPIYFSFLQHCWIRVPDVTKCEIQGLKGCGYQEYQNDIRDVKNDKKFTSETREIVKISEKTNRLYYSVPDSPDKIIIKNVMQGNHLKIVKWNLPQMVLRNPWIEPGKEVGCSKDEEYKTYLSLNLGQVLGKMRLGPKNTWKATILFISVKKGEDLDSDDDKISNLNFDISEYYGYFDGIC